MANEYLTRRAAMMRMGGWLGAGLLSAAGLRASAGAGSPTFVVLNDLHHDATPECDAWFAALFRQIAARHGDAACCLALGDLAHRGQPEALASVARLARAHLPMPFLPVPGNHDQDAEGDPRLYLEAFPDRLNYSFLADTWQFVLLDSTQGVDWADTHIPNATLEWLDTHLPRLDPARPTIIGTHFPLSNVAKMCPLNADDLLARFAHFNLRGTFSGHYHSQTMRQLSRYELVTNVCCGRVAGNHDGTTEKGYFLVRTTPEGALQREFVGFVRAGADA